MSEQLRSKHLVVVRLPSEPQLGDELERVIQVAVNETKLDIVVDFADVPTIHRDALCRLVVLKRILEGSDRQVGFANLCPAIRSVFKTHEMGDVMETDLERARDLEPSVKRRERGPVEQGRRDQGQPLERRRSARFNLTKSLRTTALLWHRSSYCDHLEAVSPDCWQCRLVDVSEGGCRVVIDTGKTPVLDEGEQIILRFSPVACEPPINFDALIRGIIRTDDGESLSLGLQFVELDTNTEGRRCLQRLCELEGRYVEAAASR